MLIFVIHVDIGFNSIAMEEIYMMKCPNCKSEIEDDVKYCTECGFDLKEYNKSSINSGKRTDENKKIMLWPIVSFLLICFLGIGIGTGYWWVSYDSGMIYAQIREHIIENESQKNEEMYLNSDIESESDNETNSIIQEEDNKNSNLESNQNIKDASIYDEDMEEDYILPDSSTRRLTDEEVQGLSKEDLRIARNEIYARHGRKFDDMQLQSYFNSKSWYKGTIGPADFKESMLSDIEKDNIQLIKKFE